MITALVTDHASTNVLVDIFQDENSDHSSKKSAFVFLTYRFRAEVTKYCEIICKNRGYSPVTAEMIADKTFEVFARKGHFAFDVSKARGRSYDESFLLYLLRISERELINSYRDSQRKLNSPYDGSEQICYDLPDYPEDKIPNDLAVELEAIKALTRVHRAIYLTYKTYQRPGFKMPRDLLASIREEFGLKQDTVNFYLKEARDKINNYIKGYQLNEKTNGKQ